MNTYLDDQLTMDANLIMTYIALGAYMFFALNAVFQCVIRLINYEDFSSWQRHLYLLWASSMLFVFCQLVWDSMVYFYPFLTWESSSHVFMREFSLLVVPMLALVLWTLSTHKKVTGKLFLAHFIPFFLAISVAIIFRDVSDYVLYVLYTGVFIYALYILYLVVQNLRHYNKQIQETYTDTHRRRMTWMINLIWLFGLIFALYVYFAYIEVEGYDWIYYFCATTIWYYLNYNILLLRETKELENQLSEEEEQKEEAADSQQEEVVLVTARQSLRELTKQRLEETLEETCLNRRLYLNPDLTVNDLASELNTNRTYVSQYFSEHHTTFLKYINDLRVEYAMYQIKNTTHKMSEIMTDSGFRHVETFRRAFQSRYNCDPKDVARTNNVPPKAENQDSLQ